MNIGDVVKLKSGGSAMTVTRRINQEEWECTWWIVKDEKYESRIFPSSALKAHSS